MKNEKTCATGRKRNAALVLRGDAKTSEYQVFEPFL